MSEPHEAPRRAAPAGEPDGRADPPETERRAAEPCAAASGAERRATEPRAAASGEGLAAALERPAAQPARLAVLALVLLAAFAAFWIFDLVDEDDVRELVDSFGPLAAPAYVVIAAVLGAALVPGPLLAATSGVLFGAAVGTVVSLASSVLSALISLFLARRAGPLPANERLDALAGLAREHGMTAVIVQRLAPGIPDAPASYAFGVLGLRAWQIALGTLIGSAPRAFSYTSIGASLDDPSSPLAVVGVAGAILTAIAGAVLARRFLTARR